MRVLDGARPEIEREFAFGVVRQLFEGLRRGPGAVASGRSPGAAAGGARRSSSAVEATAAARASASFAALHGLFWLVANLADDGPLMLVGGRPPLGRPQLAALPRPTSPARLEGLPVLVVAGCATGEPGTEPALMAD